LQRIDGGLEGGGSGPPGGGGGALFNEGDLISLDGGSGDVHAGALAVTREQPETARATIAGWTIAAAA
jgi:hypothetical protein